MENWKRNKIEAKNSNTRWLSGQNEARVISIMSLTSDHHYKLRVSRFHNKHRSFFFSKFIEHWTRESISHSRVTQRTKFLFARTKLELGGEKNVDDFLDSLAYYDRSASLACTFTLLFLQSQGLVLFNCGSCWNVSRNSTWRHLQTIPTTSWLKWYSNFKIFANVNSSVVASSANSCL